ncbi:hypothetical protein BJ684DRAFT_17496 [Piptocephalis cylindrospora]|uniref:Uncharacterized protein n=1 Tax=Piptocephalis cylindrospora TaxID=1907219 RepID=A0A4V1IXR4_9FUNG|nr:hypothetical protein BJ684DRAFT_17496 [Piptocephalis cylindrospora]|eukprot:RKP11969.1 hypothetical protein BJ684DRAFT_17496 [Piptocephalis cylindrospora]
MSRSFLTITLLILQWVGWTLVVLPVAQVALATPSPKDDDSAADSSDSTGGGKGTPWWGTLIQSDQFGAEVPLGVALLGAATDVVTQSYLSQRNNRAAKEKAAMEARKVKQAEKRKKEHERIQAIKAATLKAFQDQQNRVIQQTILAEFLAEQRMAIDQYITNQIKWEEKRRWLQLPQVQASIYTRDTFGQLAPQNASNDILSPTTTPPSPLGVSMNMEGHPIL